MIERSSVCAEPKYREEDENMQVLADESTESPPLDQRLRRNVISKTCRFSSGFVSFGKV